jgi:hypothetical protein
MNKKKFGIFVSFLIVAMLIAPVMAVAPEKLLLTFWGGMPSYSAPERLWENGNMKHMRGEVGTFSTFYVAWGSIPPFPPPGEYLMGSAIQIWDYDVNTVTMQGVAHVDMDIAFADGTFEGTIVLVGEFEFHGDNSEYASLFTGTAHGVLHGNGAYVGWKIDMNREVVEGISEREFYLFKR